MNHRRLILGLATAASTAALLAASLVPASAAATAVNITAGSAASGTALSLTGTTTGSSPQIKFKDLNTNQTLTCVSGTATGTAKTGSGQSPTGVASITATTWVTCTGPLGLKFTVTQNGAWALNATGATSGGVTPGTITNVSASVNGGTGCSFPVTGSAAATYTNGSSSGTLAVASAGTTATATLTIGTVTGGCFNLIKSGDKAQFTATYDVLAQSPYNPVTVVAT